MPLALTFVPLITAAFKLRSKWRALLEYIAQRSAKKVPSSVTGNEPPAFQGLYNSSLSTVNSTKGGSSLLKRYHTWSAAVMTEFPEQAWKPWKFHNRSTTYFASIRERIVNRQTTAAQVSANSHCPVAIAALQCFLEHLATEELKIGYPLDNLRLAQLPQFVAGSLQDLGGLDLALATIHGTSISVVPQNQHPPAKSTPNVKGRTKPNQRPAFYWLDSPQRRRNLIDSVVFRYSMSENRGYEVTTAQIQRSGGRALLKMYRDSVGTLICTEVPEIAWKRWRFGKTTHDWWASLATLTSHTTTSETSDRDIIAMCILREYLTELTARFQIEKPDDWYSVTQEQLRFERPRLNLFGGLPGLLRLIIPSYPWKDEVFGSQSKNQSMVQQKLGDLLPDLSNEAVALSQPAPEVTYLFVYGSLQHEAVRKMVLKGTDVPQIIPGAWIDGFTVASLDGKSYPGLVKTPNTPTKAQGCLLGGLTPDQLDAFDHFEGAEYQRTVVGVNFQVGGEQKLAKAFTYLWANSKDDKLKLDVPWNYSNFVVNGLAAFLQQEAANVK